MNGLAALGARVIDQLRGWGHAAFFIVDLLRADGVSSANFASHEAAAAYGGSTGAAEPHHARPDPGDPRCC